MGVDLTDYPLILAPRTLIAAAVIGIGVTMLAAIGAGSPGGHRAPDRRPHRWRRGRRRRLAHRGSIAGVGLFGGGLAAGAAGLAGVGSTSVTVAGAGARRDRHLPRCHRAQPARGSAPSPACSDGRCADRRRRRPPRAEERRSQLASHRHDRGRADDRSGARVDRARRRRIGEGDDRLDVRAVGQGRLLRHRRPRRGRVPRHARRRDPRSPMPSPRRRASRNFEAASTAP